jgi:DNA-binding Xre family transcriptional regulator
MKTVLEVRIKDIARENGVKSAKVLSEKTGIGYQVIQRYWQGGEMDRVSMRNLADIAKVLGVNGKDLIVETGE